MAGDDCLLEAQGRMIALVIPAGDLELVNGTTRIIRDGAYARQRVSVSLDFFLAEWFLDTKQGMPYFRDVLIKNPNSDTIRSVFKRRILQTPGIVSVDRLAVTLDTTARVAHIDFEATYKDGTTIPDRIDVAL